MLYSLSMQILNTIHEDYHLHSINFSDGFNTIDEIVQFAGTIGLKKIVITDHSQAAIDRSNLGLKTFRSIINRWKNVHNDVEVSFGVEADLLNEAGDICSHIDGVEGTFIVLSYHAKVYQGDQKKVADGFINAIRRHGNKINIIGHICVGISAEDAKRVIVEANAHKVPLELNAQYFLKSPDAWEIFLEHAELVYINSDAHTLYELKTHRIDTHAVLAKRELILKKLPTIEQYNHHP